VLRIGRIDCVATEVRPRCGCEREKLFSLNNRDEAADEPLEILNDREGRVALPHH
jgi:hypothetical protein